MDELVPSGGRALQSPASLFWCAVSHPPRRIPDYSAGELGGHPIRIQLKSGAHNKHVSNLNHNAGELSPANAHPFAGGLGIAPNEISRERFGDCEVTGDTVHQHFTDLLGGVGCEEHQHSIVGELVRHHHPDLFPDPAVWHAAGCS